VRHLRWQHRAADTLVAPASGVATVAADAHGAAVTWAAAHGAVATGVAAHGMAAIGVAAIGMAAIGMAAIGMAAIGVAAIGTTGMAATGAVAIGMAATGTIGTAATGAVAIGVAATGTTGTAATGTTGIMAMISSSLVASDFRGGGVGAIRMDIMEATHMVMVTGLATAMEVTRMVTVMGLATDMAMEATNMVTATAMEMAPTNMAATALEITDTATGAGPGLPSYSAGSVARVIITDPSTASWDHRRVKQFAPTSRTAAVNPVLSTARNAGESDRKRHSAILSVSTRG
jgi:hypothetical protein